MISIMTFVERFREHGVDAVPMENFAAFALKMGFDKTFVVSFSEAKKFLEALESVAHFHKTWVQKNKNTQQALSPTEWTALRSAE